MRTVGSVMTQTIVTVTPETSFKDAVRLLRRRRVSGLPVVDAKGNLVGIVSEADLLNKVEKRDPDAYLVESRPHRLDRARSAALDVASAMTRDVTTVRPDFPVALAAREMHTRGFKRLPVVDEKGKLVGIVSRGDLLKVFLRTDRDLRSDIRRLVDSAQIRRGGPGIKLTVSGGIVDLAGNLESKTRLEAIVRAISEIDGVVGVRSKVAFDVDDSVDDSRFPPINIR